jgi:putative oxidoreductase
MKYTLLIGRILFSIMFLMTPMGLFSSGAIQYAASAGVPLASVLVPLSGIMAFIGAVSIIIGYKAKIGAWLIVLFLVPVTFMMHQFWSVSDPMSRQMEMTEFMKNLSMTGGALLIAYWGAGPMSLDNKIRVN